MAYIKTLWKNRVVERPKTFNMQNNADGSTTLIPAEGTVVEAGTPVTARNMNNIEDGIANLDVNKMDKVIKDDTLPKKYVFGINNGLIYYKEV